MNHGTLLDSFTPPVNPPAEIEDPKDSMPADWVCVVFFFCAIIFLTSPTCMLFSLHPHLTLFSNLESMLSKDEREKIPDPEASKPEDWDESAPQKILDEAAEKPSGFVIVIVIVCYC